jgi:hypothetical protein
MVRYILFPVLLLSCAKETESVTSSAYTLSNSIFQNTISYSESELVHSATEHLKKGKGISSGSAEKCFLQEANRPKIQLLCAYLWVSDGGESNTATDFILKNALNSREWAIAALIRKSGLEKLSSSDFLQMLKNSESEILPLLTRAVEHRIQSRNDLNLSESRSLLNFFSRYRTDERYFVSLLSVYWRINKASFHELLNERCNANFLEASRLLCWKSLIFYDSYDLPEEVKHAIKLRLPRSWQDQDWRKFRNLFPKTAIKIQKHF